MAFRHHPSGRVARLALLALGLLTIIFIHSLIPSTDCAFAAQVTVAWDPDTSTQTAYTVPSLSEEATYYFAATAYDAARTESGFSNEITYTAPSASTYTISPAGQSFGAGGGTETVTAAANTGMATGIAGLTIAGRTFTVARAGVQAYTLSVSTGGAGSGTVTSSPMGTTFNAGTSVTLTATAGASRLCRPLE